MPCAEQGGARADGPISVVARVHVVLELAVQIPLLDACLLRMSVRALHTGVAAQDHDPNMVSSIGVISGGQRPRVSILSLLINTSMCRNKR